MPEHPLKIFEKTDPELRKLVQATNDFALTDGALPRKVKLLIAMALDAAHGAADGVRSLADQALKAGATKEEIMEAIRVTQYVSGVGSVYTAASGFSELFKE
jgi:AhpD family alkylhydroperoxidase